MTAPVAIILIIVIVVVVYMLVVKGTTSATTGGKKRSLAVEARGIDRLLADVPAVASDIKPRFVITGPAFQNNEAATPPQARRRHVDGRDGTSKEARREARRSGNQKRYVVNTDFTTSEGKPLSGS